MRGHGDDLSEEPGYLPLKGCELHCCDRLARVQDQIEVALPGCRVMQDPEVEAHGLPKAALDAVARDRVPHHLAYGQADAGSCCRRLLFNRTQAKKVAEARRLVLPARRVDTLKVSVAAESKWRQGLFA